jgi:two-component system LytT family response regulator
MTATAIRTLIVDDEPLARNHLRSLLAPDEEIEIVGECGSGSEAVDAIRRDEPDLVLLDIQIPELDGFEVIREIGPSAMPFVLFVTAYDEHALRAFEAQALDYLMKPVNRERFNSAVRRAKEIIRSMRGAAMGEPLARLLDSLQTRAAPLDRLALRLDGRILFLRIEQIDWIEAADDYVRLHVGKQILEHRDTLTRLEQRLPADRFMRIHRSTIVNVDRIREMQPWFQGDYVLIMHDGTRLTTGRSYRERLKGLLERWK